MITSKSDPVLDGVYKLCAVEDKNGNVIPKIKISENVGKITTPHYKKLYRIYNKENGKAVQIDIKPEVAQGEYSNLVLIAHSSSDFILDFAKILPGMQQPQVKSRVILAPEHAKKLLLALKENIFNYESAYGEINISDQAPRTIAPFNTGGNEA